MTTTTKKTLKIESAMTAEMAAKFNAPLPMTGLKEELKRRREELIAAVRASK